MSDPYLQLANSLAELARKVRRIEAQAFSSTGSGGGGAPANGPYLTYGPNATLTAEEVLTAGTGITLTPGVGILTVAVDYTVLDAHNDLRYDPLGAASAVQGNLATHIGLTGTSVHGLGTASTHADTDYQDYSAKLDSISALVYASTSFVKMTGANDFSLDTNTYLTSVTPHDLLSTTHGDTTAASEVRGDIIIGKSLGRWGKLAKGSTYSVLTMDAQEPVWSTYLLDGTTGGKTVFAVTNAKTLTFTATDTYNLTIPTTGTVALLGTANVFTTVQEIQASGDLAELMKFTTDRAWTLRQADTAGNTKLEFFSQTAGKWVRINPNSDTGGGLMIGTGVASDERLHVYGVGLIKAKVESGSSTGYAFFRLKNDTGVLADFGLWGSAYGTTLFGVSHNNLFGVIAESEAMAVGTVGNKPLYFGTNDTTRLTIAGDGTTTLAGKLTGAISDSGTNTTPTAAEWRHNTSGTAAAGFGVTQLFSADSSTTAAQSQAAWASSWVVATHASRTARLIGYAYDTAARECVRLEASGTAPMLGFYGGNAVARGAALTVQLTTITHTAPGTPDYAIQDFTQTSPWGFASHDEANTLLSVVKNLQTRVAELEARLGSATGVNLFA